MKNTIWYLQISEDAVERGNKKDKTTAANEPEWQSYKVTEAA